MPVVNVATRTVANEIPECSCEESCEAQQAPPARSTKAQPSAIPQMEVALTREVLVSGIGCVYCTLYSRSTVQRAAKQDAGAKATRVAATTHNL